MSTLIGLAGARFYRRHPAQLVLSLLGVALGVAVVVAVDLASASAERAFEYSRALVAGQATHVIEAATGDVPESVYAELRLSGVQDLQPVISGDAEWRGRRIALLGVDPLAALAIGAVVPEALGGDTLTGFLGSATVALTPTDESRSPPLPGSGELTLRAGERDVTVTVTGRHSVAADTLLLDIAAAQRVLGRYGTLSRIELSAGDDAAAAIAAALPDGLVLRRASEVRDVTAEMLSAFRINLSALGLLSLVVGMLLIYATMSFAVVRRHATHATLRALGVTRREIVAAIVREGLVLGLVATAAGLALGWLLANSLVAQVLATINDLYFRVAVDAASLTVWPFLKGALLGVGTTALASFGPALAAARREPRVAMTRVAEERSQAAVIRLGPVLAAVLMLSAALVLLWPGASLLLAFVGLFLVLAAYAAAVPALTAWLLDLTAALSARSAGPVITHAVRGARRSLSRTGVAVAALSVAVATVVGIGVMIDSFRGSVTDWLDQSLLADYYLLATARDPAGAAVGFSTADFETLAGLGGVVALSRSRTLTVRSAGGDVAIRAAAPGPRGYGETIVAGPATAVARLDDGVYALASEPFASRRNLQPGATLALPSPAGDVTVTVLAVYRDYRTSDNGLLMNLGVAESLWGSLPPTGIGVYAVAADVRAVGAALQRFADTRPGTAFAENGAIRDATLTVFDRTFEVTAVLRLLAATVAFFGVLSALSALQYERRTEAATLRALGFRRRDVGRSTLAQSAVLGATAGLLALPLGVLLAALLVVVINQRSYGWSMSFTLQPGELAAGFVLALAAAVAAGLLPARQLAGQPVAAGLRAE